MLKFTMLHHFGEFIFLNFIRSEQPQMSRLDRVTLLGQVAQSCMPEIV
jgi:hypothetical protein